MFQLTCGEPGCCISLRLRPEQLGLEPVTLESVNMHEVRAVPPDNRAGFDHSHVGYMPRSRHHASCCTECVTGCIWPIGGLSSHDKIFTSGMKHFIIAVASRGIIMGMQVDMEQVQLAPVNLQEVRQRRPAWEGSWPAQSRAAHPRASQPTPAAARSQAAQRGTQYHTTQPGRDRLQQPCDAPDNGYQDSGRGRAAGSVRPHSSASLPSLEQQVCFAAAPVQG